MRKIIICLALAALFCLPAAHAQEIIDRVVAVVNGEIVTLYDLNLKMKPFLDQFQGKNLSSKEKQAIIIARKKILDNIIDEILVVQEAKRLEMKVSDTEIDNHIRQVKQKQGLQDEQFAEQLKLQGLTEKQYREDIRKQIMRHQLINYMVRRKVVITEEDIKKYYNEHKDDFIQEHQVEFQIILVPTKSQIDEINNQIKNGDMDFSRAAQLYSQGPAPEQGGNMGLVNWDDLGADLQKIIEKTKQGTISSPFQLSGQWALIKVNEQTSGEPGKVEEVKEQIRDILFRPLIDKRFQEYMQELRSQAVIEQRL